MRVLVVMPRERGLPEWWRQLDVPETLVKLRQYLHMCWRVILRAKPLPVPRAAAAEAAQGEAHAARGDGVPVPKYATQYERIRQQLVRPLERSGVVKVAHVPSPWPTAACKMAHAAVSLPVPSPVLQMLVFIHARRRVPAPMMAYAAGSWPARHLLPSQL